MGNSSRNGCYNRCGAPEGCCFEGNGTAEVIQGFESKVIQTEPSIQAGRLLFPDEFGFHASSSWTPPRDWDSLFSPRKGNCSDVVARECRGNDTLLTFEDGSKYIGQFTNGCRHGYGEWMSTTEHYVGQWRDDHRDGEGHLTWPDCRVYRGQLELGMFHGTGRMEWPTPEGKMVFEGEYVNHLRHGTGRYIWSDGRVYSGTWVRGKRWGTGTFTITNGEQRQGVWTYSKLDGSSKKDGVGCRESSGETEQTDDVAETPNKEFTTATWESNATSVSRELDKTDGALLSKDPATQDAKDLDFGVRLSEDFGDRASGHKKETATRRSIAKMQQQEAFRTKAKTFALSLPGETADRPAQPLAMSKNVSVQPPERTVSGMSEGTSSMNLSPSARARHKKGTILKPYNVNVACSDGRSIAMQVVDIDTSDSVCKKLQGLHDIDTTSHVLTLRGEKLHAGFALSYYGVREGDTITLQHEVQLAFGYC